MFRNRWCCFRRCYCWILKRNVYFKRVIKNFKRSWRDVCKSDVSWWNGSRNGYLMVIIEKIDEVIYCYYK